MASWRDHARPIVARVIAAHPEASEKELRAALRDAYPFGERKYQPYKVWCDEVRRQLRLPRILERPKAQDLPGQLTLFD